MTFRTLLLLMACAYFGLALLSMLLDLFHERQP